MCQCINKAMQKDQEDLNIGVLDIYGFEIFQVRTRLLLSADQSIKCSGSLKGNSGIFKPRPYFWHEIRSSTHREQFGESRRPSEDI